MFSAPAQRQKRFEDWFSRICMRGQYENMYPFYFPLSLSFFPFFFFLWVEGDPEEWIKLATALGLLLVSRNTFIYILVSAICHPIRYATLKNRHTRTQKSLGQGRRILVCSLCELARSIQVSSTISGRDVSCCVQCRQMYTYYIIHMCAYEKLKEHIIMCVHVQPIIFFSFELKSCTKIQRVWIYSEIYFYFFFITMIVFIAFGLVKINDRVLGATYNNISVRFIWYIV